VYSSYITYLFCASFLLLIWLKAKKERNSSLFSRPSSSTVALFVANLIHLTKDLDLLNSTMTAAETD
jgi:hypothetical protein